MALARRESLPYYPPRARWYSPALKVSDRITHALALDRLRLPSLPGLDLRQLLAAFVVPGLAVYFRSPGLIGNSALAAAALLALTFLMFLGYTVGNLAFGLLLSLHVSGFVHYCAPFIGSSLRRRILFTVATFAAIGLLIYLPAQSILQRHFSRRCK